MLICCQLCNTQEPLHLTVCSDGLLETKSVIKGKTNAVSNKNRVQHDEMKL